jgi:hypothetical protein
MGSTIQHSTYEKPRQSRPQRGQLDFKQGRLAMRAWN